MRDPDPTPGSPVGPGAFPEYAEVNRAHWNRQAPGWIDAGRRAWRGEPAWGIWGIPNAQMPLLPQDMAGLEAIELGCGTAYVSAWMARRGAQVVGIDPSEAQLATARALGAEFGLGLELIHGIAESVPRPDASFDFAISEYGAAIWADPYAWIPEAWRLLRPGGQLVFLGNSPLSQVCTPAASGAVTELQLHRTYFGMHRCDWTAIDDGGIEFNLALGEWSRLFDETGFDVVRYWEVQAPEDAAQDRFYVTAAWAKRFPCEHAWRLRKR